MVDSQVRECPVELQHPTGEIGPREEPERFATRFILNDGRWTPEEHEALLRKASQAWNQHDWNREAREAALREKEAHDRSVEAWKVQVEAQNLFEHASIPFGPPPKETSSMRALPNVHDALRQNDFSRAPGSTPVLKKPPPTTGRPMPAGFLSWRTSKDWYRTSATSTTTTGRESICPALGFVPSIVSCSHDSRPSTSSTYRRTS